MKAMSNPARILGPIALATALAAPGAASAAVVNLNASQDSTIFQDGNVNNGQGIFVGTNGGGGNPATAQRGMIQFDLSSLAGATINSVTLTMHVNAQGYLGNPETVTIHEITTSWNEATIGGGGPTSGGGAGSAPNPGDPTWATHAAAHDGTASATLSVGGLGFYNFTGAGLIADVQSWASGGANYGWMMIGNETDIGSAKRFSSSENGGSGGAWVPVLTVDYTAAVVPVPAAVWLFGSGLLGLVGVARRRRS